MPGRAARAGPAQFPKRLLQRIDFPFVVDLLPLRQFESLEHLLHLVERPLQFLDHQIHLFDGLADSGHRLSTVPAGSRLLYVRRDGRGFDLAGGLRSFSETLGRLRGLG